MGKFTADLNKGMGGGLEGQYGSQKPPKDTKIQNRETTKIPDTGKAVKDPNHPNRMIKADGTFETRVTMVMDEDLHEKSKYLAFTERITIKQIVNEALRQYLDAYEAKNGQLEPIPEDKLRSNKASYKS